MSALKLVCEDPELAKKIENGGQPLIDLCRQTVNQFDDYLRHCGMAEYSDGLQKWEMMACEGLLYQMYRGRLEPRQTPPTDLPEPTEG